MGAESEKALEDLTRRIGRDLLARIDRSGPLLLSPAWLDDQAMRWSMADDTIKLNLFRFVDVLPTLSTPAELARHLREYFQQAGAAVPWWIRLGLRLLPESGPLGSLFYKITQWSSARMARKFIAGGNLAETLDSVRSLRRRRLAFTVDILGEATLTETEAASSQQAYLDLLSGLVHLSTTLPPDPLTDTDDHGPLPVVNVSVKLSSLYSQADALDFNRSADRIMDRMRPILRQAIRQGAFVHFDMEQSGFKDLTLAIFTRLLMEPEFRDWPHVGIAIQAYLRATADDLRMLATWAQRRGAPVTIRLVKGAYWDAETIVCAQNGWPAPVWQRKWQSDVAYERQTEFLLANRQHLRPAFASHNLRSLAKAMALAEKMELPRGAFEVQMLYGMGDALMDPVASLGQRVRVYMPYGELLPGMAYLVRRLLENTANDSFLRASMTEQVSEEVLFMNPADHAATPEVSSKPIGGPVQQALDSPLEPEPLADFSLDSAREAMAVALKGARSRLGQSYPLLISGQRVGTSRQITSSNPANHAEVIGHAACASEAETLRAIAEASQALPAWASRPVKERADILRRAAGIMGDRRAELAAWICLEAGKPWREADADVAEAIDFCRYYALQAQAWLAPRHRDVPGEENLVLHEPRGVTAVIPPWNFPLAIPCGMTVAALAAGCPVVLKPAEQTPVTAWWLVEILHQAGVPSDVLHYLPGIGEEVGPVLVGHPQVAVIAFTGSVKVGLAIHRQAAEASGGQDHVKRVLAEMGGKNAILVDADADLDEAIRGVAESAFGYAGQKCSACSRVLVPRNMVQPFVDRLVEVARSRLICPAEDPGCAIPPVIDAEARDRILAMIQRAVENGAKIAYAGAVPPECIQAGSYVPPHILTGVNPDAEIAQQEVFGPVLVVQPYDSLDEAFRLANGTRFALTGGLYSRSPTTIGRARREFRVGNLYINRRITGALVDRQPFGGFKLSGIGAKAGGPEYLPQFLIARAITENTMRRGFAPAS